jgi:MscS family membrane protein
VADTKRTSESPSDVPVAGDTDSRRKLFGDKAKMIGAQAKEAHAKLRETYRTNNRAVYAFLLLSLALYTIHWTLQYVDTQPGIDIPPAVFTVSQLLVAGLLAFFVVSVILRLSSKRIFEFFEGDVELEQRIFLTKLYSFALYALAILFIFYESGLSFNNIALIAGFIATGLGIAMRDFIFSYVMWFVILNKRPFRIGDHIRFGDESGRVERIGTLFVTVAGEESGTVIKLPNKLFLDKSAQNYGARGVLETAKMPLQSVPEDVGERLEKLMAELQRLTDDGASAVFSTESGRPMLVATYYARTGERTRKRNAVFSSMRRAFKGPNL